MFPENSSQPGRVFLDQGRHTYKVTHNLWDKHIEAQEGTWMFHAICCLVPITVTIPSMVARLAQYSLPLKVLLVVLFIQGSFEELTRRTQKPGSESQAKSEKWSWSPASPTSDRAGIAQWLWTLNPPRTVNCSQEHGEGHLPSVQGLVLGTFAENGRPCIHIPTMALEGTVP